MRSLCAFFNTLIYYLLILFILIIIYPYFTKSLLNGLGIIGNMFENHFYLLCLSIARLQLTLQWICI